LSAATNRCKKPSVARRNGGAGSGMSQVRMRPASITSAPPRSGSPMIGDPGKIAGCKFSKIGSGITAGNRKTSAMVPMSDDAAEAGC